MSGFFYLNNSPFNILYTRNFPSIFYPLNLPFNILAPQHLLQYFNSSTSPSIFYPSTSPSIFYPLNLPFNILPPSTFTSIFYPLNFPFKHDIIYKKALTKNIEEFALLFSVSCFLHLDSIVS